MNESMYVGVPTLKMYQKGQNYQMGIMIIPQIKDTPLFSELLEFKDFDQTYDFGFGQRPKVRIVPAVCF